MRRRLSSQTSSDTANTPSFRRLSIPPSRSSLGRPNSPHSPWYISARSGVSTGSITVMAPSQPLPVSGSISGIRYFPSVSNTVIPSTNTGTGGPQRNQSSRVVQATTGPVPSADRLSSNSLSFGAGFARISSRIVVARVSPRSSHPSLSERKRIADSIRKQASAGWFGRLSKRTFLPGTVQPCTSTAAPGAGTAQLDTKPRIFASIDTTLGQEGKDLGTAPHSSSADDVGKALFSGWSSRKNEPFSDLFQGRKDFFADLLKPGKVEDSQSMFQSRKLNGGSSRSDLFMAPISEIVEKDANETSADKYKTQSAIQPSTTDTMKMSLARRLLPQTLTSPVKTIAEPGSKEPLKELDAKRQATVAESEKPPKEEVGTAAEDQNGWLVECSSPATAVTEAKQDTRLMSWSRVDTPELRETGTALQVAIEDKTTSAMPLVEAQRSLDKKPLDSLSATIWSTENKQKGSDAPIDSSGYIPALTDSTSEATWVPSEDHRMAPRSLDGPSLLASDMTEFPVFDASKTSEPETSKNLIPRQRTDGDEQTSTGPLVPREGGSLSEAKTSSELVHPDFTKRDEIAEVLSGESAKRLIATPIGERSQLEEKSGMQSSPPRLPIESKETTQYEPVVDKGTLGTESKQLVPLEHSGGVDIVPADTGQPVEISDAKNIDERSLPAPAEYSHGTEAEAPGQPVVPLDSYLEQVPSATSDTMQPSTTAEDKNYLQTAGAHKQISAKMSRDVSQRDEINLHPWEQTEADQDGVFAPPAQAQEPSEEGITVRPASIKAAEIPTHRQDVAPYEAQDALQPAPDKKDVSEAQEPKQEMSAMEFADTNAAEIPTDGQDVAPYEAKDALQPAPDKKDVSEAQEPNQEMSAMEFADTKAAEIPTDGQDVAPYEAQDALQPVPDKKDVSEAQEPKQEMSAMEFADTKAAEMPTDGQDVAPYEAQDALQPEPDKKDVSEAQEPKQEMAAMEFADTKAAQMSTDGQDVVPYESQDALRREPDEKEVLEAQEPKEETAAVEFAGIKDAEMSTDSQDVVPYKDQYASLPEPDDKEVSEAHKPQEDMLAVKLAGDQISELASSESAGMVSLPVTKITENLRAVDHNRGIEKPVTELQDTVSTLPERDAWSVSLQVSTGVAKPSYQGGIGEIRQDTLLDPTAMKLGSDSDLLARVPGPVSVTWNIKMGKQDETAAAASFKPSDNGGSSDTDKAGGPPSIQRTTAPSAVEYSATKQPEQNTQLQLIAPNEPGAGAPVMKEMQPVEVVPGAGATSAQTGGGLVPRTAASIKPSKKPCTLLDDRTQHPYAYPEYPPVDSLGSPKLVNERESQSLHSKPSAMALSPFRDILQEPGGLPRQSKDDILTSSRAKAAEATSGSMELESEHEKGLPPLPLDNLALLPVDEINLQPGELAKADVHDILIPPAEEAQATQSAATAREGGALAAAGPDREVLTAAAASEIPEVESAAAGGALEPKGTEVQEFLEYPQEEQQSVENGEERKPSHESEPTVRDILDQTMDNLMLNDNRGPLLAIKRTEKHSVEKKSERILKRSRDVQHMESITGVSERFVVSETKTQVFDEAKDSGAKNPPENARTEPEESPWKFGPDGSLSDLIGREVIEETEPSQPGYVENLKSTGNVLDISVSDDAITAPVESTNEAESWSKDFSDDREIQAGADEIDRSVVPNTEKAVEDGDSLGPRSDADEKCEPSQPEFPPNQLSLPKESSLANYNSQPDTSLTDLVGRGVIDETEPNHTAFVENLDSAVDVPNVPNVSDDAITAPVASTNEAKSGSNGFSDDGATQARADENNRGVASRHEKTGEDTASLSHHSIVDEKYDPSSPEFPPKQSSPSRESLSSTQPEVKFPMLSGHGASNTENAHVGLPPLMTISNLGKGGACKSSSSLSDQNPTKEDEVRKKLDGSHLRINKNALIQQPASIMTAIVPEKNATGYPSENSALSALIPSSLDPASSPISDSRPLLPDSVQYKDSLFQETRAGGLDEFIETAPTEHVPPLASYTEPAKANDDPTALDNTYHQRVDYDAAPARDGSTAQTSSRTPEESQNTVDTGIVEEVPPCAPYEAPPKAERAQLIWPCPSDNKFKSYELEASEDCAEWHAGEDYRRPILVADDDSIVYTRDVRSPPAGQRKSVPADGSPEKTPEHIKDGTPPLKTSPDEVTSRPGTPPTDIPTSDGAGTVPGTGVMPLFYEYTAPAETVSDHWSLKQNLEQSNTAEDSVQARSTERDPYYSLESTLVNGLAAQRDTGTEESTMPYASSQQQGYAQDENREPAKASEQNLESAVLSADMREWFHDVGAPKDKYAFSVQTEIPEEDVAYEEEEVPTVYGCSGHEQKEEKSPDTVSEPADPFVKPAPVIVEPSPECREAESPSVVRDASDVKGADEEQGAAVSSVAPFDQTSPNTFTDGDALPSETTNSNPALVSDAAGVPKKPGQKRRLSFSDETGVSDEIAFPERKRLSISVDTHAAEASPWDGSGRRSITAGAVSAFGEHEGLQQPTSLNIVIPEEEYSRRRGELSGTTESKKSLETDDEEELPFNENEKQSFPTRNIEEIQHTASASTGSLDQYNAPLEGSSPRSAPKDAAEDAGETRSPRNEDNKMERPDNADASLPGEKFEGRKSSFSSSTATLGPSNEQSTIPCDNATAVPGEAEGKTDAALRTIESSFAQRNHMGLPVGFEDTFPDAADATSAGGSGASHSSVTVGYSHRPQSDGSGAPGAEDNSDDLELLKARVLGPKARIEKPGTEVQMGPSDTFSQSGPHGTDSLFLSDPLQSGNADVAYAAAIALKDTDLHVTSLSAAVIDGATGVAEEFNVPYTEQKVVVESEASSSQRPLLPQCKTAPGDEAQTQDVGQTIEGIVQQASDAATSRPRASDEAHGASTSNEKDECVPLSPEDADKQGEDDDVIAPGDVPEDDVRSPDAVSRCEELCFSNFRTVVEYMANPSVGSDTNIVYDSFVPPESRVIDALDSVYHDTEFTVRAVDDYDISGIMYDCWSKEVTSVAPTLKTFWTYSPHSFLLCVDEEGTHCGIISALVFDNEQAFCAPNHVKGEFLSEGVRRRLWDALLRVLRGKNAFALVPAEQVHAYHRHLGFYTSARGLALHGRLSPSTDLAPFARAQLPDGVQIMKFKKQMFKALLAFDESTFGFGRRRFWKLTLREGPISFRLALADEGTRVCGYAGLQNDVYGVPVLRWLVADDGAVAQQLLYNLLSGSLRFRQRGAWMAIYARSHASEALLKHTDTSHFEPCMLVFNRREPFLQYKNISVLTYI